LATDDVYVLSLRALLNGKQVVNSFAFRLLTAVTPTSSSFQGLANVLKNGARTNQVDDLVYQDWRALQVRGAGTTYSTTPPFRTATVSYAGAFTGTLTGALTLTPASNMDSIVVAYNTALAGRRHKGRSFFAGIAETAISDASLIASTAVTAWVTDFVTPLSAYFAGGTDLTYRFGVWSDRTAMNVALSNTWPRVLTSQGTPDPANAFADVESADVRQYVGAQRDRRPGI
jgi:hypothetical protein